MFYAHFIIVKENEIFVNKNYSRKSHIDSYYSFSFLQGMAVSVGLV